MEVIRLYLIEILREVTRSYITSLIWCPYNCPWGKLPPGWLLPDYCSRTISPKIIGPRQYSPGNCPQGKLSFGWFVVYKIAPRANSPEESCLPRKIVQSINYTRCFSPGIRNLSTLIDNCFLLFSFFVI